MSRWSFATMIITAVAIAAPARADDDANRRAEESFRQATEAFNNKQYVAAAAAFEQAARFKVHPAALLDAAEAWEHAGEYVRAAENIDRVLVIPGLDPTYLTESEERLKKLTPNIGTIDFRGPRTVLVRVDGGAEFSVPARIRIAPGHHTLTIVDLPTSRASKDVLNIGRGETRDYEVTSPAPAPAPARPRGPEKPTAPTAPASPPSRVPPLLSWIGFGVACAAAGTATVFGVRTLEAQSAYNASPSTEAQAAFYRERLITNAALGVSAAAAAAGAILWVALPSSGKNAAVSVAHSPGGGYVLLRVQY